MVTDHISVSDFVLLHAEQSESPLEVGKFQSMAEAWRNATPQTLLWIATRRGTLTEKEYRQFACYCAKQIWRAMPNKECCDAVSAAEAYLAGLMTEKGLCAAYKLAKNTYSSDWPMLSKHAYYCATECTLSSAYEYCHDAYEAAISAARACGCLLQSKITADDYPDDLMAEIGQAGFVACINRQAAWLRANVVPNFKGETK